MFGLCGVVICREPVGAFGWYPFRRLLQFPVGAFGRFSSRVGALWDTLAIAWRNGVGLC